MVKQFKKGDVYSVGTYRTWLINFDQSSHGKFLVFGSKEDVVAAIKRLEDGPMKNYSYKPKVKELSERLH